MSNAKSNIKSLFIETLLKSARTDARILIESAEQALAVRDFVTLTRIGARLCEVPAGRGYYDAGLLYKALALNRAPGCQEAGSVALLELAESSGNPIRSRALLALGSNEFLRGDSVGALRFYQKAASLNSTCPLFLRCSAVMMVAAGVGGLDALNRIYPLARYIGHSLPSYGLDYLNSVAVELNAAGHVEQARRIIAPVIVSPFARAYPEWRQTAEEISVERKPQTNVLAFPEIDRASQVRRIERVIWDQNIDGYRLKRGADALVRAVA